MIMTVEFPLPESNSLLSTMNRTQDIGVTKFAFYDTSNGDFIDLVRD
jgi:hypothetical protein